MDNHVLFIPVMSPIMNKISTWKFHVDVAIRLQTYPATRAWPIYLYGLKTLREPPSLWRLKHHALTHTESQWYQKWKYHEKEYVHSIQYPLSFCITIICHITIRVASVTFGQARNTVIIWGNTQKIITDSYHSKWVHIIISNHTFSFASHMCEIYWTDFKNTVTFILTQ